MYSTTELQQLHRAGQAHKLPSGAIIPTSTSLDVHAAILQAKKAHRTGADDDDPGLRRHLVGRAAVHGLRRLIPASWGHEQAGKSAMTEITHMDVTRIDAVTDPANGYGVLLAKSAAPAGRAAGVSRQQGRENAAGQALVKSWRYETYAEYATNRETREVWLAAARAARQETTAGSYGGMAADLAKAAEYERLAGQASDPAMRNAYEQLAKQAREAVMT